MMRAVVIGIALAGAAWGPGHARDGGGRRSERPGQDALELPALASYAAPAALGREIPFDVVGVFSMTIGPEGSTRDIQVLSVMPASKLVQADVPAALAADVSKTGTDALKQWRYNTSAGDAHVRVTLSWWLAADKAVTPQPRRVAAVEACLPPAQLAKPTAVPFLAEIGRGQELRGVSFPGGPEYLHNAARTLLDQWRFGSLTEGTRIQSVLRFFPADCRVAGW
jgi:hypothetical protein